MSTALAFPSASVPSPQFERARQQAVELEGIFLNTLMKEMFASLEAEGGFAEETWRGMQAEQFADAMAKADGIGLANAIVSDLIAVQSGESGLAPIP